MTDTMRITALNCRLHSEGGVCPPLPFIEVEQEEALRLIALGNAREYVDPAEVVEPTPAVEPVLEPELAVLPTEPDPETAPKARRPRNPK